MKQVLQVTQTIEINLYENYSVLHQTTINYHHFKRKIKENIFFKTLNERQQVPQPSHILLHYSFFLI